MSVKPLLFAKMCTIVLSVQAMLAALGVVEDPSGDIDFPATDTVCLCLFIFLSVLLRQTIGSLRIISYSAQHRADIMKEHIKELITASLTWPE